MMIILDILIGISFLLFVGEVIVQKLPQDKPFVKWWRDNVIGRFPDDNPNF
jgi:hypothetical protein